MWRTVIPVNDADIVVGLPSLNEADTITHVTSQVDQGLTTFFPEYRCLIVNCDSSSCDGTTAAFLATPTTVAKTHLRTGPDRVGKGINIAALLEFASALDARAVAMIDADLRSIEPSWMRRLLAPVVSGEADFVAPLYRASIGGPLTSNFPYPIVYGLYGLSVRQPIGGEFAFGRALVRDLVATPLPPTAEGYGIDIFLTTEAIATGSRIAVADLGYKVHTGRDWHTIAPVVTEVVASAFAQVARHRNVLASIAEVRRPRTYGGSHEALELPAMMPDVPQLHSQFVAGTAGRRPIYEQVLSRDSLHAIDHAQAMHSGLNSSTWCDIVYAFIRVVLEGADPRTAARHLMPLFFGRLVRFAAERAGGGPTGGDRAVEHLAELFFERRAQALAAATP